MLSRLKLTAAEFSLISSVNRTFPTNSRRPRCSKNLLLPFRGSASHSIRSEYGSALRASPALSSEPSVSTQYLSSVGSSSMQLSQWTFSNRHILVLNVIACAVVRHIGLRTPACEFFSAFAEVAVSATWLFVSAIPTLLAFKRAAVSLEKLMDVTREELPGTMAAIRLSGVEISDLTMELSDLGQEITQGVRNSTRAVRVAEERLSQLTNIAPSASAQVVVYQKTKASGPLLARTARSVREGIVKGRAMLQVFLTLSRFSWMALNYFSKRGKR